MRVEKYQCDRPGCTVTTNGHLDGWWAVYVEGGVIRILTLENSDGSGMHFCGVAHCLAAVSEQMTVMQEAK